MSASENINTAAFEYYKQSLAGTLPGSGVAAPTAVQGTVADDAAAAGNPVPVGGVYNATKPAYTSGDRTQLQATVNGNLDVQLGVYSQSGSDGFSNASVGWGLADGTSHANPRLLATGNWVFNGTSWDREVKPSATSRIASTAASVNATSAKASAGNVYKIFGNNTKASVIYLKIYNKATAPTVGTDTPVLTIPIAASGRFDIDIGGANGFYLGTGIAYGFTTDAADAGTTALLAGDILGFTLTYS